MTKEILKKCMFYVPPEDGDFNAQLIFLLLILDQRPDP